MKKTLIVLLLLGNSLTTFAGEASALKQSYLNQKNQVKSEMTKIAFNYPAASAAWVATAGSLAATFTDTLTEQEKAGWLMIGTLAAFYCLTPSNEQECEYVFKNMTAGSYLLADYDHKIKSLY